MKLALIKLMIKYYTWRKKLDDKIIEWLKIKKYAIQAEIDIMNMRSRQNEKEKMGRKC